MPPYLRNTLNWMAFYGETDNPNSANTGNPTAYSIVTGCHATDNPTACCNATNPAACYPTGVTSCGTDSSALTATCYDATKPYPGTAGNSIAEFSSILQRSWVPGPLGVRLSRRRRGSARRVRKGGHHHHPRGHLLLLPVVDPVRRGPQTRTTSTRAHSSRSRGTRSGIGHLRRYTINTDSGHGRRYCRLGCGRRIEGSTAAASRDHKDLQGRISAWTSPWRTITKADLAVAHGCRRAMRWSATSAAKAPPTRTTGSWATSSVRRRSRWGRPPRTSTTSGIPANPTAFTQHRANHLRATSPYSGRVILAGANDGQLHAFRTSDGSEAWSFIPPNLLSRLKLIAHATEPSSLTHQYYVDGPVTVADAWIPGSCEQRDVESPQPTGIRSWSSGRGGAPETNLWSSSTSCDSGFNPTYTVHLSILLRLLLPWIVTEQPESPSSSGGSDYRPPRRPTWARPGAR